MPDNDEAAARLRAAFAYARPTFSKKDRAAVLGVSERTVGRWQREAGRLSDEQWESVISATGVPRWFIANGFAIAPEPEEPTLAERLEALERKVDALVKRREDDEPPALPSELLQLPGGQRPTGDTDRDDETDQDSGAAGGTAQ